MRDTPWSKFRTLVLVAHFYTVDAFILQPARWFASRFDRRAKSYLHFTCNAPDSGAFYPVSGPQTVKTARRHGRKWWGRATKVNPDGTWSNEKLGDYYSGFWFFSSSSAPVGSDLEESGYTILTRNGREDPPIY